MSLKNGNLGNTNKDLITTAQLSFSFIPIIYSWWDLEQRRHQCALFNSDCLIMRSCLALLQRISVNKFAILRKLCLEGIRNYKLKSLLFGQSGRLVKFNLF